MGRFAAGNAPEADAIVCEAIAGVGADIEALRIPHLAGVVLGGGYGRGEGGAMESSAEPKWRLSNDLDFFAVTKDGASGNEIRAIASALEPVSKKWTEMLGIDVDFIVRTPWRIRHDEERLMIQELVHGYVDVAGEKGEALFANVARRTPDALPWMEAARLMMNRGVGLLLAMERGGSDGFVTRNINKCILGAGDAMLIARHGYEWRAEARRDALGDGLYARALEWKFRPGEEGVCDIETARGAWLGALGEIRSESNLAALRRTARNAARWVVRRKSLGALATFGLDPVVRVLAGVTDCLRARKRMSTSLRRDWEVFN